MSLSIESWPAIHPFRITGREWTAFTPLVCAIEQDGCTGHGEAHGVYYQNESAEGMKTQVESARAEVEAGATREALQQLLPPGGARNAVDCALWDLQAKLSGQSVWEQAGLAPDPVQTVFTIGLQDTAAQMAENAAAATAHVLLKIKLDGHQPAERIQAIREARPDACLLIDANQGWSFAQLQEIAPLCADLQVAMIEQPLPRGADECLESYSAPLPLCGDESCLHRGELEQARRRYQMINIKLDKAGGLTEGLQLAREATAMGLELMVGSMGGTSMAMAPAHVLGQLCKFVDIDGPLLLKQDRETHLDYRAKGVFVPERGFWGMPDVSDA